MKKILSLITAIAMLMLMLTGCGANSDHSVYLEAQKNTAKLTSTHIEGTLEIEMDVAGTLTVKIPMELVIKTDNTNPDAPVMQMTYTMTTMGMEITADAYYADGYVYTATTMPDGLGGTVTTKIKTAENAEDVEEDIMSKLEELDISSDVEILTEADFETITKQEIEGGNKYTLSRTPAQVQSMLKRVVTDALASSEMTEAEKSEILKDIEDEANDINFSSLDVSFAIVDNYFTEFDITAKGLTSSLDMLDDLVGELEDGTSVDISARLKLVNPGTPVTVTAPTDLDEYMDMDDLLDFDDLAEYDDFGIDFDF